MKEAFENCYGLLSTSMIVKISSILRKEAKSIYKEKMVSCNGNFIYLLY